jgi:hypothetical protein
MSFEVRLGQDFSGYFRLCQDTLGYILLDLVKPS